MSMKEESKMNSEQNSSCMLVPHSPSLRYRLSMGTHDSSVRLILPVRPNRSKWLTWWIQPRAFDQNGLAYKAVRRSEGHLTHWGLVTAQ